MILPKTSEYGLKAAVCLAILSGNKSHPVTVTEISKKSNIPKAYLSKILRLLVTAKILKAKKGVGGGFYYDRPLEKITLMDILTATHFSLSDKYCPFGLNACNNDAPCLIHNSYSKVKQEYLNWVNKTTLADIAV